MMWKGKSALTAALVVASLFYGGATTSAVAQQASELSRKRDSTTNCPARIELDLLVSKASIALEQAEYSSAVDTLRAVSILDCNARISLLLAAAYEGSNSIVQAEQTLEHAHTVWPADTSIATSLAREYLSAGDQGGAAKALDHFHASASTPWPEIQLSVVIFLATHDLSKAESLAHMGYKSYPSVDSLLLLANTIQLEGRYKDVIALLSSSRDRYATSAKFLVTLAESEYDASTFDSARRDVEQAIALDKSLYQEHYLLGNILMKQGDAESAAAAYRVALQLAPDQPRTYYHLALALRAMHNEAEEESLVSKAIEIDDHYGLAHCELGRLFLNQNRVSDAVTQLELAVKDNPSSEEAYSLLARAYDQTGAKDKAEEAAKQLAAVRRANHQAKPLHDGMQDNADRRTTP